MNKCILCLSVLCLGLLSGVSHVQGENSSPSTGNRWGEEQGGDLPLLTENQEEMLDEMYNQASEMLIATAEWIDSFFDDERSVAERNTTRGTLKLSFDYLEDDGGEVKPRFDLRLRLPRLSNKAQLIILGSEDPDFDASDSREKRASSQDNDDASFVTALRYFFRENDKYNLAFDVGVSWDYLYSGFRFRHLQDFGTLQGRFANRLRYYTDDGWENKTFYDLEFQLDNNYLFRSTSEILFSEGRDGYPHGQHFRIYQRYSSYQALSYESSFLFETEPEYNLYNIRLLMRYRQRFYRDWLVMEISPNVEFPEDNGREPNPGVIFKFEAAIGCDSGKEGYHKVFY
uniref:Uncharacterized protein n=1 Tax=Desulforhopalus singaporensis TaxID=91360 RepID=A0A1H0NQI9_9BACT|nr:hypothetical protein [Desulforhopalus singaporensis]SDO94630.1 hypothetical protein SAMN05660330_01392 [Desulforhopalus singaporensis]